VDFLDNNPDNLEDLPLDFLANLDNLNLADILDNLNLAILLVNLVILALNLVIHRLKVIPVNLLDYTNRNPNRTWSPYTRHPFIKAIIYVTIVDIDVVADRVVT